MTKFYAYWLLTGKTERALYKPDHIPKGCQYYCPAKKRWLKERAEPWWWTHLIRRWPVKQGQGTRSIKQYELHKQRNRGL